MNWNNLELLSAKMCINLCASDLTDPEFPHIFDDLIASAGVHASELEIEITEREALDIEKRGVGVLTALRSRGAELVLDDFGTGYSALSYLRDLPVTCVKIDKSFLPTSPTICKAALSSEPS